MQLILHCLPFLVYELLVVFSFKSICKTYFFPTWTLPQWDNDLSIFLFNKKIYQTLSALQKNRKTSFSHPPNMLNYFPLRKSYNVPFLTPELFLTPKKWGQTNTHHSNEMWVSLGKTSCGSRFFFRKVEGGI